MNSPADQPISALRSGHDELAALVAGLGPDDLTGPSAASDWDISQVLGHLGSGAEISLAALDAALAGTGKLPADFNKGVWARWDGMTAAERGAAFPGANRALVERYESLDADARNTLRIDLGFLPQPVDVATAAGLRLNEFGYHSWDVRVVYDPTATIAAEARPSMLDLIGNLFGWIARPAELGDRAAHLAVHVTEPARSFGLRLADSASITDVPADPDGVLRAPADAWLRLAGGRLAPHRPAPGITVEGPVSLEDLRRVFPGF
ncbi:maleylpyruvate isomerase family mycothiol-dependent enzyme [Longispora sp. K20-0274]|uniref:maleylpyruvate isomerase family mycothiol-dependent enzyme n=1 Tax=Longispora sp. K20-0274 TaxID=3088255 RepID=UPI00399984E6